MKCKKCKPYSTKKENYIAAFIMIAVYGSIIGLIWYAIGEFLNIIGAYL